MELSNMTQNQIISKIKDGKTLLESLRQDQFSDEEIVMLLDSPHFNSFSPVLKESILIAINTIFEQEMGLAS